METMVLNNNNGLMRKYEYITINKNYINNKNLKELSPYITFNRNIAFKQNEKKYIMNLLKDCFNTNSTFKALVSLYDSIYVTKNIHQNHFNIILVNQDKNERSETLHVGVFNNRITQITQVITLL